MPLSVNYAAHIRLCFVLERPLLVSLGTHGNDSLGSDSHRDVIEQSLGQLLLHRLDVSLVQVGPQETDAAVNVKTHAA